MHRKTAVFVFGMKADYCAFLCNVITSNTNGPDIHCQPSYLDSVGFCWSAYLYEHISMNYTLLREKIFLGNKN